MTRRHIALLSTVVLLMAACSSDDPATTSTASTAAPSTTQSATEGDDDTAPEPPEIANPFAEVVISTQVDPDTGELIEVEETFGPPEYAALLEAGIEAGTWTEVEGLELLLGHAVGAVPSSDVPGADGLVTREFSELLEIAHALSLGDEYSADELEGIRRWYELAVPGPDTMAMLEATSPNLSLDTLRSSARQTGDCAPIDPEDFSGWAVVEGCYLMLAEGVAGVTVRVFYPAWYEVDEFNAGLPMAALQALVQSTETFANYGTVGDVDVIFSLVDTEESGGTLAVANHDATWGESTRGGACPVSLFPLGFNSTFENTVAHEVWHCVQREMGFPRGVVSGTSWFREAGAQYFANTVFPVDAWFGYFDSRSTHVALFDMSYEAWVWWQFIGSRETPKGVADLHKAMSDAGDGGRGEMVGRAEQFQRFVVELMAGQIQGPVDLPPAERVSLPTQRVNEDDEGRELTFRTGGFVASRYLVGYDKELRVFQSDASPGDVNMAMVKYSERRDTEAWKEVLPEVRSECQRRAWYIVAATTETPQSGIEGKITIDTIEEASCDPCVLGAWRLDNASFEALLKANMGSQIPAGSDFSITGGDYLISFDDEGQFKEKRAGFTITVTAQGLPLNMVIDGYATGEYSADGENMTVDDLTDLYVRVDVGGFGGGPQFVDSTDVLDGSGTYECDDDVLEITIPEGTVWWDRVEAILEPDDIEEG